MKKLLLLLLCFQITVGLFAQWGSSTTIDSDAGSSNGNSDLHITLLVVNNNPAAAYYQETDSELRYVRATNTQGTTWGAPQTLDGASDQSGEWPALAIVNSNPAIAYEDAGTDDINFIRANDASGSSWPASPVTVFSGASSVVRDVTMAVVGGFPAIAFVEPAGGGNFGLKYVRASDVNGTTWGSPMTIATDANMDDITLLMVNGRPAVCYTEWTDGDLFFIRADDATGSSWPVSPVTVVTTDAVGHESHMAIVNGNPAICHLDQTNGDLMFSRASDINGSAWTTQTIETTDFTGRYPSLAIVENNPAISYKNGSNEIEYIRATDMSGTSWSPVETVAESPENIIFGYSSLAVVDGNPAIVYYESDGDDMKYVRASNTTGILPVDYISFTGKARPEGTVLEWETSAEINNAGFDVEWSSDRKIWKSVGFVDGVGNTFANEHYSFTHDQPAEGVNYYRLKQTDYDGAFEYSKVVSVQFSVGSPELTLFPNPVKDGSFTLYLSEFEAENIQMEMYDYTGQLVRQTVITNNQTEIQTADLNKGLYLVKVTADRSESWERVVIQ